MDITQITNAVGMGIFLAFMIGPVFFMLIQTSILKGFRAAFVFDIGVVLADVVFLLMAYFGSRNFLEQIKDNPLLYIAGGLIMLGYGLIVFFSKKEEVETNIVIVETSNYFKLFVKGFLLNFINVGVLGFWVGMVVIYGAEFNMDNQKIFNFFALVICGYLLTDIGKILLAKKLRNKMTPTRVHNMKQIMGGILVLFGVFLVGKGVI